MVFTAAIAGASGYAGGEVARLLASHPRITPVTFTAHTQAGQKMGSVQPHLRSYADVELAATTAANLAGHDVVFLGLPHGASGEISAELARLSPDSLLVDLGADHRLRRAEDWEAFYSGPFHEPWVYGVPELLVAGGKQRDALRGARRIAAPGCNASTVSLALAPGVQAGLIDTSDVVATLAVGPSGAGRALKPHLLASEILGSASPYAVGGTHRHIPEIKQALRGAAPAAPPEVHVSFTPMLVPMARGILAVCTAPVVGGVEEADLRTAWENAYAGERFVQLLPAGEYPSTVSTQGANTLLLSVDFDRDAGRVVVVAALDNLAKGTAGAAIQSVNIALGLDEGAGLPVDGVAP